MYTLVTGANGFIGRHLVREIAAQGRKVVGTGHGVMSAQLRESLGLHAWISGPLIAEVLNAIHKAWGAPESIYHLAGGSSVRHSILWPREDFLKTVQGTLEVYEWVRVCAGDAPIILVSSAAVYGAGHSQAIIEGDACQPCSPYGFHKQMAEWVAESYGFSYGIRSTVVRFFSLYGEGLQKQLVWDFCQKLSTNPSNVILDGHGLEQRDFMEVTDAVDLLIRAEGAASQKPFIVNGSTGVAASIREVAEHLLGFWGSTATLEFTGNTRTGDPAVLVGQTGRAREILDFKARVELRQGLDHYVRWYQKAMRG